jgi:F-type H+-transporting ATPase subunit b
MLDIQIGTMLVQGLSFLLLTFILNAVMYKPILRFVQKRDQLISDAQGEVEVLQKRIEQKAADYEKALNQAKGEALGEKNNCIAAGAARAKEITDAARSEVPALLDAFNQQLGEELGVARRVLQERSALIASEIATKVLGRGI